MSLGQHGAAVDAAACGERRFQPGPAGRVIAHAFGRKPGGQRIDGATHFVKLADARRIELGNLEAALAALGDETLPVQQMQRVRHRLARDAEPVGEPRSAGCAARARACGRRSLPGSAHRPGRSGSEAGREGSHRQLRKDKREYGIPYSNLRLIVWRRQAVSEGGSTPSAELDKLLISRGSSTVHGVVFSIFGRSGLSSPAPPRPGWRSAPRRPRPRSRRYGRP